MSVSVVIAAGGTGGHLVPALALADALMRRRPGARVAFVGARRGMERSVVPEAGYRVHLVDVLPFARTLGTKRFLAPAALLRASWQARRALRAEHADAVVGMGGYPSLPAVAAARSLGLPSVVHEQNAVPGIANRLAARLTPNVALALGEAAGRLPRSARPRVVGMPLRPAIAGFDREALRAEALAALGLVAGVPVLLVAGGSLGAARLNDAAVAIAGRWRDRGDRQLLVSAGRAHAEHTAAALEAAAGGTRVRCVGYIERMELAYAACDLALCRAGGATVAELAATSTPALLVPYPHHRDRQQHENALALVRAGGALVVSDGEAAGEGTAALADELLGDLPRRAAMSAAARSLSRPGAADALADWALALAERRPGRSGGAGPDAGGGAAR